MYRYMKNKTTGIYKQAEHCFIKIGKNDHFENESKIDGLERNYFDKFTSTGIVI